MGIGLLGIGTSAEQQRQQRYVSCLFHFSTFPNRPIVLRFPAQSRVLQAYITLWALIPLANNYRRKTRHHFRDHIDSLRHSQYLS